MPFYTLNTYFKTLYLCLNKLSPSQLHLYLILFRTLTSYNIQFLNIPPPLATLPPSLSTLYLIYLFLFSLSSSLNRYTPTLISSAFLLYFLPSPFFLFFLPFSPLFFAHIFSIHSSSVFT